MVVFSLPDRVRFLVNAAANPCCVPSKRRKSSRRSGQKMVEFLFCENKSDEKIFVFSTLASVGAAVIGGGLGGAAVAACVPIIVPMSNSLIDSGVAIGDDAKNSMTRLTMVNSLQLSFGLIEFLTGDIVNGFTHMLMAGVGFYVVKVDGIVLLPSYSVASTVFASVSLLNMLEMLLYKGSLSGNLTMTANFLRLATVAHPFLYAASAYFAWNLIEQLRRGLLTNNTEAQQTASNPATVMFEPTVPVASREPFLGRGFRLDQHQDQTQALNDTQ